MIKHPSSNNAFIPTTIIPQNVSGGVNTAHDIISIKLTEGEIQLVVARNNNGEAIVYAEPLVRRDVSGNIIPLIPYIGIFGSANQTRIANSTISTNPTAEDQAGANMAEEVEIVGATPFPKPNARNTLYNLIFHSIRLANFLGFDEQEQNPAGTRSKVQRFTANEELTKLFSTNTYLIEMLSETLDSYDSYFGGRKNILAPIPLSDHIISRTGIIHYEPNNLMFINLKNDKEKLIRNIRARIITNAYSSINIEGLAEICLLLKG